MIKQKAFYSPFYHDAATADEKLMKGIIILLSPITHIKLSKIARLSQRNRMSRTLKGSAVHCVSPEGKTKLMESDPSALATQFRSVDKPSTTTTTTTIIIIASRDFEQRFFSRARAVVAGGQ